MEEDYSVHKVVDLRRYPLLQKKFLFCSWNRIEVFLFVTKLLGFSGLAKFVGGTRVVQNGFIKRRQLQDGPPICELLGIGEVRTCDLLNISMNTSFLSCSGLGAPRRILRLSTSLLNVSSSRASVNEVISSNIRNPLWMEFCDSNVVVPVGLVGSGWGSLDRTVYTEDSGR